MSDRLVIEREVERAAWAAVIALAVVTAAEGPLRELGLYAPVYGCSMMACGWILGARWRGDRL